MCRVVLLHKRSYFRPLVTVSKFFFFKVLKIKLFSKNPAMLDAIILPRTN